jgi:uncharacterized protein
MELLTMVRSRCDTTPHRFEAALITGASSGIGRAFALALPETTALLLVGRDAARLEAVARAAGGRRVETRIADLATPAGLEAVAAAAEDLAVDLLINNAGIGPFGPFLDNDEAVVEATVKVNALAPVLLARRLLPGMLARAEAAGRRAGLINVASSAAFVPVPGLAVYAATKAFDLALTEAIAAELLDRPIDVLALCPGATRTPFGERAGFGGRIPFAVAPERVAREALAALGRQRTLVTGRLGPLALAPAAAARNLTGTLLSRAMRLAYAVAARSRR